MEANGQRVIYNDINSKLLEKLKKDGKRTAIRIKAERNNHFYWICTGQVDDALESIGKDELENSIIVIRSNIAPGELDFYKDKYKVKKIAHIVIGDMFNPDRIVVGLPEKGMIENTEVRFKLQSLFESVNVPFLVTDSTTSAIIKLVSNAWLSTQISFWNEIKSLCGECKINAQYVSNAVTMDKRISKYGSNMLGEPFGGMCQDLQSLITQFTCRNIFPLLLDSVRNINEELEKGG